MNVSGEFTVNAPRDAVYKALRDASSFVRFVGTLPEDPDAFDVVIMNNLYLGGAPEMRPSRHPAAETERLEGGFHLGIEVANKLAGAGELNSSRRTRSGRRQFRPGVRSGFRISLTGARHPQECGPP